VAWHRRELAGIGEGVPVDVLLKALRAQVP
jgi:hypothetical protein